MHLCLFHWKHTISCIFSCHTILAVTEGNSNSTDLTATRSEWFCTKIPGIFHLWFWIKSATEAFKEWSCQEIFRVSTIGLESLVSTQKLMFFPSSNWLVMWLWTPSILYFIPAQIEERRKELKGVTLVITLAWMIFPIQLTVNIFQPGLSIAACLISEISLNPRPSSVRPTNLTPCSEVAYLFCL